MTGTVDVDEFIDGYLAEVEEHLRLARSSILVIDEALKKKEHRPKAVRDLFRSLHTIKGLSAMIGAEPIVDLSHELETVLRSADRAGGKLPSAAIDGILKGLRAIEERLACLAKGEALPSAPKHLLEALSDLQIEEQAAGPTGILKLDAALLAKLALGEQTQLLQGMAQGKRALRVDFVPSEAQAARGLNITRVRERLGEIGELVKVIPRTRPATDRGPAGVTFVLLLLTDAPPEVVAEIVAGPTADVQTLEVVRPPAAVLVGETDGEAPSEEPLEQRQLQTQNVVRVEVGRLDDALERLSDLVVTRARLQRAVSELAEERGSARLRALNALLAESGRQLRDLGAALVRARMVPVAELLERVPLLVRGLSRSSNKSVQLTVEAGSAELDKSVSDRLFPAIVHLLRNAVDHAIEGADERRQLGKPPEGALRITCLRRSATHLALEIADDGRGVDRERVALRAGQPVPRDDQSLLQLITRPGLSTLEHATHTSGRGFGMDIVKRIVVDELGGELRLSTQPAVGTCFTLIVPLSVTILEVFSFRCGERTLVVPVGSVEELAEIERATVSDTPHPSLGGAAVRLLTHRGTALPLLRLNTLLGVDAPPGDRPKAIIVRRDAERFAFEVDALIGQQEVVVRPLSDPLVNVGGVAGTADLGDGRPTLVLDLLALARRARLPEGLAP